MKKTKSVGGVILNNENEVAIVSQFGETWSLPKGHIEEGEDPIKTAIREIYEETGIIESNLEYVKFLITYERVSLGGKKFQKDPELKEISLHLFKTSQQELKPIDPHNPEAIWVKIDEVENILSSEIDAAHFNSIKKDLV